MNHKDLYMKMFKANYKKSLLLFICNAFLISVCLFFSIITFNSGYQNTRAINFVLEQNTFFSIRFVFLFAMFFIPYSHISYNMQKEKEYGVLETIGIDNNSIRYAVVLDNTLIAVATMAAGFLLGTGFSILFNKTFIKHIYPGHTVGALSTKGYEITAIVIGAIYFVTVLCIAIYISSRSIKKLLTDERRGKEGHSSNKILIAIGIALIIGNVIYIIFFYNVNDNNALILCYFLIALGMLLILYNSLCFIDVIHKKKPKLYYANILHISDLRYRFANNKRIFIFTICLIGIVVYFQVFAFALAKLMPNNIVGENPYHIMYQEDSDNNYPSTKELNEIADKAKVKVVKNIEMPVYLSASNRDIISSDVLKEKLGIESNVGRGECIVYTQYSLYDGYRHEDGLNSSNLTISNDKANKTFHIKSVKYKVLINTDMEQGYCVVINDKDYSNMIKNVDKNFILKYRVIQCANLKQSEKLYRAIDAKYDMGVDGLLASSEFGNLKLAKQMSIFIIMIISIMDLLIFLLNIMMIHFKLLTNLDSDRKKYGIIRKLGFTMKEVRSAIRKNINTLMIWPVVIAIIYGGLLAIGLMRLSKFTMYTTVCVLIVGTVLIVFQYILSRLYTKYYIKKLLE